MRIIQFKLDKPFISKNPIIACIGYFDGLHLGHKKLVDKTLELASKNNLESALITFSPDPWEVIKKEKKLHHITSMKQRINRAASLGIKNIIILNFTPEMASLSPDEFVTKILKPLNINTLICGFDFHFGYKGQGDIQYLQKQDEMKIEVIECVLMDNEKISSSRIEQLLLNGSVNKANRLLGYHYQVEGTIIHGHKQGRTIGFPTANIALDEDFIIPSPGVYAGYIKVYNKWYKAMINIGHNPTFNLSIPISIEAYILDFNLEIYGKRVVLEFDHFIRSEKKFNNKSNLALQLEQDVFHVRKNLKNHE